MPRSETKKTPRCLLCRATAEAGCGRWCAACHRALAAHAAMMGVLHPYHDVAARRAADPARLARIARYEGRAALRLPLFAREEVPACSRR